MIKIIAKSVVKKGEETTFMNLAKELIEKSRIEKGCFSYDLYEDIDHPGIFVLIEEWKDEDAVQLHNQSDHSKKIVPQLDKIRIAKEVNLYRPIG